MRKYIVLVFLCTLMLPISSYSSNSAEANKLKDFFLEHGYKEVPLRLSKDKNFLFVDVSIGNERIDRPFILDTGSTKTSIDQQIQKKYQFKKYGKYFTAGGAGGNYFRTYQVVVPGIKISNFSEHNQLVTVQHYAHIKVNKKPIGGMIGLDFLRKNDAILDVENHRMFLKIPGQKQKINQEMFEKTLSKMKYELIRLDRTSSGHQTLLVRINDEKPVSFMLDTGVAPSVMLDDKYARSIAIDNKGKPLIGRGSSNAVMKIFSAKVYKLSIGPINSGPESAIVTTGLEFAKIGIPVLGVIGLTWMRSHQAIIDTSNDLLFAR